jgi:hypothetical protein
MRRDMDFVREILLRVEAWQPTEAEPSYVVSSERPDDPAFYHVGLLSEARFIRAVFMNAPPAYFVSGLTWAGHDFLDSVRDDSVWAAVKRRLGSVSGAVSLDVLKAVVTEVVSGRLGLGGS